MVGVGVAEGGGTPAGGEPYYGEYYTADPYYVPQEMCPHPQQHPPHAHMCTVHADYGGMPVVTSTAMVPQMMPAAVMYPPHPHHAHQPPPPHHHQPHQHHYGATNGASGPQHYYGTGYPTHYHVQPHHMPHYQPQPVYQKDERTQRQHSKLKQKFDRKYNNRNNGTDASSGASTPSLSPRKELNGSRGASSGRSEGESSSASASLQGDDDDTQAILDLLSATRTPQVSEMTPTTALVQWNSPLPEGVTLPRGELTYDLLLGDRGRYRAIYSGPKLSCVVCDLRPGCEYSVCLQIRAGETTGAASEAATFRAPAAPPERPAAPRLTNRSRATIALRWPAAADNGARLAHYVLEMNAGAGWHELARPRTRQHTAHDLQPQTLHRFRLAAVNECGRSDWSEETQAWTMGAPPPAPAPPRLLYAETAALALGWERRAPDDEYTLQVEERERGHGYLPVYSGPDGQHLCTGLRRATDYRFRLRCENADGQGPWSTDVTYCTLPERPAPPARPTLRGKAHSRTFRLRWEPPVDDGGAPVQSYTLELDDGDGFREAYRGADREAHCDRLRPGTAYRARVSAENAAGVSEWSPAESVSTEAALPGPPLGLEPASAPRASQAAVRWRAPLCGGGADLTEWQLDVQGPAATCSLSLPVAEREATLRDLAPGTAYTITVAACNRVGVGSFSAPLQIITAAAPPAAPAPPCVTVESPRRARVFWSPPHDNGSPILDYRLEMSAAAAGDSFNEIYRGLETERLVADLTPFSAYFFRVCATNAAGRGAASAPREVLTPPAPPAAPAPPRYEPEAAALRLRWRPPAAHGAPLLRYRLRVDDTELEQDAADTERLVDGLTPDTVYCVRVAAENELGLGDWSEAVRAATRPPPPAPPALSCVQRAHNHLKLKWADGPADDTQYRLEMRAPDSREFRPVYRGNANFCKVKKLRESTVYAFRIRASDERGGCGEWGEPLEASTSAPPPPAPPTPHAEAGAGAGRALVSWEGDDGQYAVQVCRAGGQWRAAWAGPGASCWLEELEAGAEYAVRVCAVRGGGAGPWSPAARLVVAAARAPRAPRTPRPARPLAPRHAALLAAAGFLLLAVLVAILLQHLLARP